MLSKKDGGTLKSRGEPGHGRMPCPRLTVQLLHVKPETFCLGRGVGRITPKLPKDPAALPSIQRLIGMEQCQSNPD